MDVKKKLNGKMMILNNKKNLITILAEEIQNKLIYHKLIKNIILFKKEFL